jgi:hypothetical protein
MLKGEISTAFGTLVELRAGAVVVSVDPFFTNQRAHIVTLAAHHAVPAIYGLREFAASGSLMSYERLELQALDRGLGSEGPADFRSRRRNGHDRMPVASHFAASYKASGVLIAARRRGSLARSASPAGPFACDRSVAAQPPGYYEGDGHCRR